MVAPLFAGALALGALGGGIGLGSLFGMFGGGGQTQEQAQGQETKAETEVKAPIEQKQEQELATRMYDYSKVTETTNAPQYIYVSDSPYTGITANPFTSPSVNKQFGAEVTPSLTGEQTPSQVITPSTDQTPKFEGSQKAEATATTDMLTPLLIIAGVGVGGYYLYKEVKK
jgi:hypothetical protein